MDEAKDTLDVRGLKCPLPALFAKKRLAAARAGTEILVIADDPMAAVDIPHMCHNEGYDVLAKTNEGGEVRFTLRRPA